MSWQQVFFFYPQMMQSGESSRHKHSEGEADDLRQADGSLAEGHKEAGAGIYQGNDSSGYRVKPVITGSNRTV